MGVKHLVSRSVQVKESLDCSLGINSTGQMSFCFVFESTGDSLYPEKPESSMSTEKCLEELQQNSPNLHRIVIHNPYQCSLFINITPKYKHIPPLTTSEFKYDNKL